MCKTRVLLALICGFQSVSGAALAAFRAGAYAVDSLTRWTRPVIVAVFVVGLASMASDTLVDLESPDRVPTEISFATEALKSDSFEFDGQDTYDVERRDLPRPSDLTEARGLWRQRLRYEYLQEKLNKKKPEEIVRTLTKRYAGLLRTAREVGGDQILDEVHALVGRRPRRGLADDAIEQRHRLEQQIERRRLQLDAPQAQGVEQVLEVVRQCRHARDAEIGFRMPG